MTSISALHNSTALTLLKGAVADNSGQQNRASAAGQILAALSANSLLPDSTDTTGKIVRILLDHGELIAGGSFSEIKGTEGDDIITAHTGNTINAGAGNDYIDVSFSNTVNGGAGDDVINGFAGNRLNGEDGDDVIRAMSKNQLSGGAGNDNIGALDSNVIDAGGGSDNIQVIGYKNVIDAGDGNDRIQALGDRNIIVAGSGADVISATAGNVITGGLGNDVITLTGERGSFSSDDPREGTGSVVKYAAGDGADALNLVRSASTLDLGDGISAENTHISVDGNQATISFDGSDTDSIVVQLTPDSSLAVKFSDGSSQQISFDASKDFDWRLDPESRSQHLKAFGPTQTLDPAAVAAVRAYSQA